MIWKVATFNVNGIRARLPQLMDWVHEQLPDVLCLQEIKCQERDFPEEPFLRAGYALSVRGQKAFNGVAVITRNQPTRVLRSFDDGGTDVEARLLAVAVDGVWVVNTYIPQGRDPDHPAFQDKLDFFGRLARLLSRHFTPDQPLLWVGDMNVAPAALDVFDPKRLAGQVGFHPAEQQALANLMEWGFVDLFRQQHPQQRQFTFWDYRLPKSFARNLGWRLDHIMATAPMAGICLDCQVDTEPRGRDKPSDHTPVWAEFDLGKLGGA